MSRGGRARGPAPRGRRGASACGGRSAPRAARDVGRRRLCDQLFLAAREVVVDGAAGRAGALDHLREGGGLDAVLAHEDEGALDHPFAGVVGHVGSYLTLMRIIVSCFSPTMMLVIVVER